MEQHILPDKDIRPHSEDTTCECNPQVQFVEGNMIVIHNAFYELEEEKSEPDNDFKKYNI